MKKIVLLLCFLQLTFFAVGQSFLTRIIDFEVNDLPVDQALDKLSKQTDVDIAYSKNFFKSTNRISIQAQQKTIEEVLRMLLLNTGIEFETLGENRVLLFKGKINFVTISGYVEDVESGERLVGAYVFIEGGSSGAVANEFGFFSLDVPPTSTEITIRSIGYKPTKFDISMYKKRLIVGLTPMNDLPTVTVNASDLSTELSTSAFNFDQDNVLEISPKLLKALPTLSGNADFVRIAQLIPGVQGQADGFGGINIRGGESGQNLMLMDGTPVYIPYHLMGLYSTYNPETVKSLKLVKGNFPARYGNAVSAVLDVQIKDGNMHQWKFAGEVNLLNAGFCLEGPFKSKKGSLLIAGRYSPFAYFFEPVLSRLYFQNQIDALKAQFYDFNLKAHYELSPKDHVYLSVFSGQDVIFQTALTTYDANNKSFSAFDLEWKNLVGSFRWNHLFSDRLFLNTTLTYSKYATQFTSQNEFQFQDAISTTNDFFLIDNRSHNTDLGLKLDADYACTDHHHFRFGATYNFRDFTPSFYFLQETKFDIADEPIGEELYDIENVYQSLNIPNYQINTGALYLEDHFTHKRLYLNSGLHISSFFRNQATFINLEPRFLAKYRINEFLTSSISANRRIQYLQLISNPSIQLPNDLWLPSGKSVKPQTLVEFEAALQYRPIKNLRLNLAVYQRYLNHVYAYPEGVEFLFTTDDYTKFDFLVSGKGKSEGIELMADYGNQKRGFLFNYTLSKSTRQFDAINLGLPFAANFDSRHQLRLAYHQNLNKAFKIGFDWVFRSAQPKVNVIQIASSGSFTNLDEDPPGLKNTTRSTVYNRFDVSMQYHLVGEHVSHSFKFGIYNLFNTANTAFYEIQYIDPATSKIVSTPIKSLPILPSFAYRISFE